MILPLHKKILRLAITAGEIMMKNGAEIYRVEDTITRICKACHMPTVEIFATPTGMFVSIDPGNQDEDVLTYVSRLHGSTMDLGKISAINSFSREFTTTDLSIDRGLELLKEIDQTKPYPLLARLFSAGLISAVFCLIFSGTPISALLSVPVGIMSYSFYLFLSKYDINYFIKGFSGCVVATFLSLALVQWIPTLVFGSMIVGVMMLFVPGAAITNSIRDFLSADMLSGLSRMVEAIIISASLGIGVALPMKIWSLFNQEPLAGATAQPNLLFALFLGFLPAMGFAILFHGPKRCILPAALIGGLAWGAYQFFSSYNDNVITACFLAALLVGIFSDLCSRLFREAATVFIIPGIIPLVPGAGLYGTMVALLNGNYELATNTGIQTLLLAGAIATALMVVGAVVRILLAITKKITSSSSRPN